MARLIDAENYRNLFNEEFKKTMELIRKGETHLDTLAEGFTEADRVIRALPTIDPVTAAAEALGMSPDRLRELAQADKADEIGKYRFYYCESKDEYLIGARLDTFYYARWDGSSFTWSMSRYLPWGKHVVAPETAWKEYTYPSEPKEIGMSEWFKGFLGKLTREAAEAALKEREAEHE